MIISQVAFRYARSLMELSQEKGLLSGVHEDMLLVSKTCSAGRDLVTMLKSPVLKADKKNLILERIFAGKIGELSSLFLSILVRKGREQLLPEVAAAFNLLYREEQGIVTAQVASAVPLSTSTRERVLALSQKQHPGKTIELVENIEPDLIGGLTIRIGDEQFDGTVSRRLADLRREFSKNPYIPAI